jgi:hypothetical protein
LVVTTDKLEAQHVELDAALTDLSDDLGTAGRVRRLIEGHLGQEEQFVLPVWMSSFTAAEQIASPARCVATRRCATPG